MQQQTDWYETLKLSPDAPTEQVEQAVERLSRQATALAVTAPERSQQLRDTVRKIKRDLLSGPESRARYDAARTAATSDPVPAPEPQAAPQAGPQAGPEAAGAPGPTPTPTPAPAPAPRPGPADAPWYQQVAGGANQPPGYPWPAPGGYPPPPAGGPPPTASPGYQEPGYQQAAPPGYQPPAGPGGPRPPGVEGLGSRIGRFLRSGWVCSSCGKEAMPSDKFCTKCGTVISPTRGDARPAQGPRVTCTGCSAPLGANDAFCSRCGTPAGDKR